MTFATVIKAQVQLSSCVDPCHVELTLNQDHGTRALGQTVLSMESSMTEAGKASGSIRASTRADGTASL